MQRSNVLLYANAYASRLAFARAYVTRDGLAPPCEVLRKLADLDQLGEDLAQLGTYYGDAEQQATPPQIWIEYALVAVFDFIHGPHDTGGLLQ